MTVFRPLIVLLISLVSGCASDPLVSFASVVLRTATLSQARYLAGRLNETNSREERIIGKALAAHLSSLLVESDEETITESDLKKSEEVVIQSTFPDSRSSAIATKHASDFRKELFHTSTKILVKTTVVFLQEFATHVLIN